MIVKESHPSTERIIYFSEGAVSQYKNYTNFTNLCYHEADFGLAAEWHFFATSHGKSQCEGLCGTVKRVVETACLQSISHPNDTPQKWFSGVKKMPKV